MKTISGLGLGAAALAIAATAAPLTRAQTTTDVPSTTVGVRKPKPPGLSFIQGTDVGLDLQKGRLMATGTTNAKGILQATWTPGPGDKGLQVGVERSRLSVATVVRVETGRQVLFSAPIMPGKGIAWASNAKGIPLVAPGTGRGSQSVKITLTTVPPKPTALREVKPVAGGSVVVRRYPPK